MGVGADAGEETAAVVAVVDAAVEAVVNAAVALPLLLHPMLLLVAVPVPASTVLFFVLTLREGASGFSFSFTLPLSLARLPRLLSPSPGLFKDFPLAGEGKVLDASFSRSSRLSTFTFSTLTAGEMFSWFRVLASSRTPQGLAAAMITKIAAKLSKGILRV